LQQGEEIAPRGRWISSSLPGINWIHHVPLLGHGHDPKMAARMLTVKWFGSKCPWIDMSVLRRPLSQALPRSIVP